MKKSFARIFLLAAACAAGMSSCQTEYADPAPYPTAFHKSYISTFIACDSLTVHSYGGMSINKEDKLYGRVGKDTSPEGIVVCVFADEPAGGRYGGYPTNIYYPVPQIGSTGFLLSNGDNPNDPYYQARQTGYDKYVEEVGDTAYNRKLWLGSLNLTVALRPLKEVTITADKSFAPDLPAGSDLNKLFKVIFDDVYTTIRNGYKHVDGTYRREEPVYLGNGEEEIQSLRCLPLVGTRLEDYLFPKTEWEFFLDAKPEETEVYTFHVRMTFTDGTTLEADAPPILIKRKN